MKKFLLLFFTIFLIIAFNSCQLDSEEEKTTWEKYEPKALSSITFKGNYTYEQKMKFYADKETVLDSFNKCVKENYNVYKWFDVRNKIKATGEYKETYVVYLNRGEVETITIDEVKNKLFEYNKNYENPCFAFVSTAYAKVGICVYYISDGKIMYDWYDSYYMGE